MSKVTKQELREYLQEKIEGVSSGDLAVSSSQIVQKLVPILEGRHSGGSVLLYRPMPAWHELDLTSLPDLLPNIRFDFVQNTKNAPFPEKKYDVIIIPLLGFNKDGYRLGHGGGWYDHFLTTQSQALKIGVGYENTLVDFTPEPHDVRMDVIILNKS